MFEPKIENIFSTKPNFFVKSIAISIAAIIAVSPIISRYFNIVSPVAIIANLVIVPALFVITVVSFIFILLDLAGLKFILVYMGNALSLLTQATFYINHLFAQIPFSFIRVASARLPFLLFYYAFIFSFFFSKRKKELVAFLLLTVNIVLWGNIFTPQTRELKITFLDVGKGDSILLEFPNRTNMLIDAGPGGIEGLADMGRSVVAPILWNKGIRRLDAIVSTHFHSDHAGGTLYILDNFNTGCVMDSDAVDGLSMRIYDNYRKIISRKNLRRLTVADGDQILGFGDVKLFVINPPQDHLGWDTNDSSVVLKLEYKNFSALLCGDASGKAIESMLKNRDILKSNVLKVPHHGGSAGKEGLAKIFFEEVSPSVIIISSGINFHSKNLSEDGIYSGPTAYNTRDNGAIEIVSDGLKFSVKAFKQKN